MTKKGWVKLVCWVVPVMVVLIVMFQNTDRIPFVVLFWKPQAPMVIWLVVSFVLGAGAGAFAVRYFASGRSRAKQGGPG